MTEREHGPAAHYTGAPWDTTRLRAALRQHHTVGWALLEEVSDGTGAQLTRYADAVAMALWPSRGLMLHGFEIKASRADWLNELRHPTKANAVGRYCDYWWLVVGQASIVWPGELPPDWGLMAPELGAVSTRLRVVVSPKQRTPDLMDRTFLAALLRRVHESSATTRELEAAYDRGCRDGWSYAEAAQPNLKRFRTRAQRLLRDARALLDNERLIWRHGPREE